MASFINLAGEVWDFDQTKWISTGQSTQQSWSSHGELYCYQTDYIFFERFNVSKADCHQGNERQGWWRSERRVGENLLHFISRSVQKKFLEVCVRVRIRTKNLGVSPRIGIKFWKKVRIKEIECRNTPSRWLSGVLCHGRLRIAAVINSINR